MHIQYDKKKPPNLGKRLPKDAKLNFPTIDGVSVVSAVISLAIFR